MVSMVKSDLFRRFASGFAIGAVAMVLLQSPEHASDLITSLKGAAGILA